MKAPALRVAAWLVCAGAPAGLPAATLHGVLSNGPPANRVNVTFLAEGYTSNQLALFRADATNALEHLLARQPFLEYRPYFNAQAIAVASTQAGVDHPLNSINKNTYFNAAFIDAADTIIAIPPHVPWDTNYSRGQGKVDALLQTHAPATALAVLLVNDSYGGSGGATVVSSRQDFSLENIVPHETAHTLAGLGDEYETPYPGYPDVEEPNTTRETNRHLIKWRAWIEPDTPLPTPPDTPGDVVGLFEGAHYHSTGWYRPQFDCLMRSLYVPFCKVCTETLILSFYRHARPVDAFSPASTNLLVTNTSPLTFAVTPLRPATHALRIQWLTNGTPVAGATNETLPLSPADLGRGTNHVSAVVRDDTPWVRNDPSNRLSQTLTWTVRVETPALALAAPRWLGAGRFTFVVTGAAPAGFSILAATNTSNWTALTTNTLVNGQFRYTNTAATQPWRFFRARTPPGP